MVKAVGIATLIDLVKTFSNDQELGTEFRKFMRDTYGIKC